MPDTRRRRIGRWTGASALACLALSAAPAAADCMAVAANANVVEVSEDGQTRKGSGVVLTYDGYIITAAHLITDDIQPPYPLVVSVRAAGDGTWLDAKVKRIDQVLDLALLKLASYADQPSLTAVQLASLGDEPVGAFCLAGYGIEKDALGRQRPKDFFAFEADYLGLERGYIVGDQPIEDGYSGGAAFRQGALLGMIVRRRGTPPATMIVPTEYILDFVAAEGLHLDGAAFAPGVPASELSGKIENNRKNIEASQLKIERILRSVEWLVELQSGPKLVIKPQRAFPGQIVDGTFIADLIVDFDSDEFRSYIAENEPLTTEIGVKLHDSGALVIDDLASEIDLIRAKYAQAGVDLGDVPYTRIRIDGWVQFEGFASDRIVHTFDVP